MSLDVDLVGNPKCDHCGHEHVCSEPRCLYTRNITHNLNTMADKAGIYLACWRPKEIGVTKASELAPLLAAGLAALKADPARFKELNPANGWGDYDGLVNFVEEYLAACERFPDATIRVSR